MSYIDVSHICKEFRITKRDPGLKGALKSMIRREYAVKKAVDDISFSIEKGELVGYIGPNGAGKSTTIKMLSGILTPTSGRIMVGGIVPYENRRENNLRMGVVFGQRSQLYWDLPMGETFGLYKRMYRIGDEAFRRNVDVYVELLGMQDFLQTPVRQLSLGQKMRGNIAVALLHDPEIVYLDEPTIGLDVVAKDRIRRFLREVNREKNTTLILTTHDMDDIESVCNRLIMIDTGKKLYDGSLSAFRETYTGESVLCVTLAESGPFTLPDSRLRLEKEEGPRRWIAFKKTEITPMEALAAVEKSCVISDFLLTDADIEVLVREIYEK